MSSTCWPLGRPRRPAGSPGRDGAARRAARRCRRWRSGAGRRPAPCRCVRNASNTAATRIAPRSCGSVSRGRRRGPARAASTCRSSRRSCRSRSASAPRLPIACPNCCASSPSRFWLARSPRVAAIWCRSTSGREKCWNSATMSANASWNASTSGLLGSLKRRCMPSSSACVVSWAMMSCDRQVNTVSRAPRRRRRLDGRREVAEQQRLLRRAVVGVRLAQRVRVDAQPLDVLASRHCALPRVGREPCAATRARAARARARSCGSCASPPRTPSAGGTAGCSPTAAGRPAPGACGSFEVDRRVEAPARRIVVDHLHVLADRPGLEQVLSRWRRAPRERRASTSLIPAVSSSTPSTRVEGEDAQPPLDGRRHRRRRACAREQIVRRSSFVDLPPRPRSMWYRTRPVRVDEQRAAGHLAGAASGVERGRPGRLDDLDDPLRGPLPAGGLEPLAELKRD